MPVTRHPLHRFVHAELPHTALALGSDDQTLVRVWMADVRSRQPALNKPLHSVPFDIGVLAAAAQDAVPQPGDPVTERL